MSFASARFGGNATPLPGAQPFGILSRRAAIAGAAGMVFGITAGSTFAASAASHLGGQTPAFASAFSPASPDAHLIAHAERLVALARRCDSVADRQATLEDRLAALCPEPDLPTEPSGFSMAIAEPNPSERVFTVNKVAGYDHAYAAWQHATAEAEAAHADLIEATADQLGLPEVERRADRMARRRDRWAIDLASMRPVTTEGLGAKAVALSALLGTDRFTRGDALLRHGKLLDGLLADAVRLGVGGQA